MDTKQLTALLKLLRKNGVTHFKSTDVELTFSPEAIDLPVTVEKRQEQVEIPSENPYVNFPDRILTEDELTYYSAGGTVEDSPFEKDGKDN